MFEKGQQVKVTIEDVSYQGQGIGHVGGFTIFVEGCLPGDTVLAELFKVKKRFAFARLLEIVSMSGDRIEPVCRYAGECGGCIYSEFAYEAQLKLKRQQIIDRLERLGGIETPTVGPVLSMDEPYHYRNKAIMHIENDGGRWNVGFRKARSHAVVDCQECILQTEVVAVIADAIRKVSEQQNGATLLRHMDDITVRIAFGTSEVMIIFGMPANVAKDKKNVQLLEELIVAIDDAVYGAGYSLESVYVDDRKIKMPLLLAGKRTIDDLAGDLKFEISPRSFYQVNPTVMRQLYDKVAEYAGINRPINGACESETILDIYCGTGTIGLWYLKKSDRDLTSDMFVLGIESEKQAIIDANRNAVINGIVNARYVSGRAEDVLPDLLQAGNRSAEESAGDQKHVYDAELVKALTRTKVAILDPPRAGCKTELLDALLMVAPERIVYVSCDPATMARDIKRLTAGGYRFVEATPIDMFPWTGHVETVVLMSRVKD